MQPPVCWVFRSFIAIAGGWVLTDLVPQTSTANPERRFRPENRHSIRNCLAVSRWEQSPIIMRWRISAEFKVLTRTGRFLRDAPHCLRQSCRGYEQRPFTLATSVIDGAPAFRLVAKAARESGVVVIDSPQIFAVGTDFNCNLLGQNDLTISSYVGSA